MWKLIVIVLLICPMVTFSQEVDSVAWKQVDSLIKVSKGLAERRDFEQAVAVNEAAEALAIAKFGKESVKYANAAYNRGRGYYLKGDYLEAEKWYLVAKDIQAKMVPSKEYASTLNDLGNLYQAMTKYEESEQCHLQALSIREQLFGKESQQYASSLNNLGILFKNNGYFEKSENYYLQARDIYERVLGPKHTIYATCLNNLGTLYIETGDYEQAEAMLLKSKVIREEVLGKEHQMYALSLSNLGLLYMNKGEYEKSLNFHLEAREIREKVLGKSNMEYATSLGNLGNIYRLLGDFAQGETLFLENKGILEAFGLKGNPNYWWNQVNLAILYREMGKYAQAEPLFLESLDHIGQLKGKEHQAYLWTQHNLALSYWASGNLAAAQNYLAQSAKIEKKLLIQSCSYFSEEELAGYIFKFNKNQQSEFSFAQIQPEISGTAYDNALFYKGFLLNAVSQVNNLALNDSLTTEKYNQLKSYRRRLSVEYAKPTADQKNVAELEEKANTLEKDLTRSVAGFGNAIRQVTWQEVQQQLKPGEAAIEFVHYRFVNPNLTDSIQYAALVLTPDGNSPAFVPLFEEKQLDSLLQSQGLPKNEFVNGLYTHPRLYELIWQPLEPALEGITQVYFSLSGLLHRINPGAMATPVLPGQEPTGATLSDRYRFSQLGSTRQLVIPFAGANSGQGALLYGGIQYKMDSTAISTANAGLKAQIADMGRGINFGYSDSTSRGDAWDYLKWTEVEINTSESILSDKGQYPVTRMGYTATEESFKQLSATSPRIIHLATHGYFFPDPPSTSTHGREPVFKVAENPMIRSGLVLAGGNYAWQTGKPFRPDLEDGILTAYEISQMDLRSTELVVLSACETGLGDIQGNEGVYGLQRAFKIAGAKYLIMSLWQVPDFHTQELITTFYSRWLEDNMPIPEAFRSAQAAMRERYHSPFLWAGFVLVE